METSIEKLSYITIQCDVTRKLGKDQNYKTTYKTLIPHLTIKAFLHSVDAKDNKEALIKKAIKSLQQTHTAINYYTVKALCREINKSLSKQYFKRVVRELGLRRDVSSGIACFY